MNKDLLDDSGTTDKALKAIKPILWTAAGAGLGLLVTWLAGGF